MIMIKKHICILLAAACAFFMFAGCKNKEEEVQNNSSVSGTEQAVEKNKELIFAGNKITEINPLLDTCDGLSDLIFSGLMKIDKNGSPVPDLAESYHFDEETLTYTFQLREGVMWHDGELFTADDVAFTYSLLTQDENLESVLKCNYSDIESVKSAGPYTVEIKLKKYNASMLNYLTIGILPVHLLEGDNINSTAFNQAPVGTGRYRFVSGNQSSSEIHLERNEYYYDKVPEIESVIYRMAENDQEKAAMLKNNEADLVSLSPVYSEQFKDTSLYTRFEFDSAEYCSISFDYSSDFWTNNADSMAVLNYAADKEAIIKNVLKSSGSKAFSPIQYNSFGGNKKADIYSYNLDTFAKKMEKLGWKKGTDGFYARNGEKFTVQIQVLSYEDAQIDIANMLSLQLKNAGIDMQVQLVEKIEPDAETDGFLTDFSAPFEPDELYQKFTSNGSANITGYSNSRIDTLLNAGRHEKDLEKRKRIYQNFETAYSKNPGEIPIAYMNANYAAVNGLKGIDTGRMLGGRACDIMWNIENWTIVK